jgi:hypothetical protein
VTADLLWTPPLRQQLANQLSQFAIGLDAASMVAGRDAPSHAGAR